MTEAKTTENWFTRHAKAEAKKDIIPSYERIGNIVGVVVGLLVVLYFIGHQTGLTGFFTSKFGPLEMLLFYGTIAYGIVSGVLKGLFGRKNKARLLDVIGACFDFIAIIWLYTVFPFDFAYLADVLPDFLKFLLLWITNDIARVLMILAMIVTLIMAIYTAAFYLLVRRELSKPTPKAT
ncbi:MAG: hypothetical protein JSV58_04030 [Candidatus Bathyarchaeota archaeon]|nr:MAG: hypothetical protein JSV58_04030 [Candidatus Bathyarchaeota archaeon]